MTGGNAGDVNYPEHMLKVHKRWLYGDDVLDSDIPADPHYSVDEAMRDAWTAGSPFENIVSYGGIDQALGMTQSAIDRFTSIVETLHPDQKVDDVLMRAMNYMSMMPPLQFSDVEEPEVDVESAIDTALGKMTEDPWADQTVATPTVGTISDPSAVSDPSAITPDTLTVTDVAAPGDVTADLLVTDAVNAFELRQKAAHLRGISNIADGFFTARAVTGSQFGMALALLEAERQREYNDYDERLRVEQVRLNHSAAVNKRELTLQGALREAELALQADTREAEMKVQVALRRAELMMERDLRIADLISRQDTRKAELDAQASTRQVELQTQWDIERGKTGLGLASASIDAEGRFRGLKTEMEKARAQAAIALVGAMYGSYDQFMKSLLFGQQAVTGLQGEQSKTQIQMKQNEIQFDLEMEVRDALWDLEIWDYGRGVMSSIAGAGTVPGKSKFDRFMDVAGFGVSAATGILGLALPFIGMMSDRRMKCDLRAISRPLDTLLSLKGQRYRYRPDLNLGDGDRMGFMAQDVAHVLPEWVGRINNGDMYLKFQPFEFEALAVEAIRELTARVEALENSNG